jgi:hypothetical protein
VSKVNVELSAGGAREVFPNVSSLVDCHPELGGWYFDDPAQPSRFHACPKTCDRIKAATSGTVTVAFGCATIHG